MLISASLRNPLLLKSPWRSLLQLQRGVMSVMGKKKRTRRGNRGMPLTTFLCLSHARFPLTPFFSYADQYDNHALATPLLRLGGFHDRRSETPPFGRVIGRRMRQPSFLRFIS